MVQERAGEQRGSVEGGSKKRGAVKEQMPDLQSRVHNEGLGIDRMGSLYPPTPTTVTSKIIQ
jgi:hypothetical protein